jgi:prepilin peptidase CpaA
MNSVLLWRAFILAFAATAAYADLRWRTIPRGTTLAGFLAGLVVNVSGGHAWDAAGTALLAFSISLGLFSLGAIGGGDVKLITALAAMLRFHSWTSAMQLAIYAAAAIAVIQIVRRGAVRQTARNIFEIFRSFFQIGLRAHPVLNVQNNAAIRSPFAVAAAVGTVVVVLRMPQVF